MAVDVEIKQKTFFKLNMNKIISLSGLSYGILDEAFRIIENQIGENTILYDSKNVERGFELSMKGTDILLRLAVPTGSKDIQLFYNFINQICKKVNATSFIRNGEEIALEDISKFIKIDEEGSINAIQHIINDMKANDFEVYYIFGVRNPIAMNSDDVKNIGTSIEKFDEFLLSHQMKDVYYAAPKIYNINNKIVGMYAIGPDIPSVIPFKPSIIANNDINVEKWFIFIEKNIGIEYSNFINNVDTSNKYDFNHTIVNVSKSKIQELVSKFGETIQ